MGRADVLFRFLQLAGKNRPKDINEYLHELDPEDERPIVDQLVDLIIAGDEQGYDKYDQARKEVSLESLDEETRTKQSRPQFLNKWIEFERKLRSIAQSKLGNYTGPLSPSLLQKLEVFSDIHDLQIVETLLRVRNQIVHGADAPEADIVEAEKEIERLLNSLEGQYSIAPRHRPRNSSVVLKQGFKDS